MTSVSLAYLQKQYQKCITVFYKVWKAKEFCQSNLKIIVVV